MIDQEPGKGGRGFEHIDVTHGGIQVLYFLESPNAESRDFLRLASHIISLLSTGHWVTLGDTCVRISIMFKVFSQLLLH